MNKLSKEKRTQLVAAGLVIALVLASLYFALIRPQQRKLQGLTAKRQTAYDNLNRINDTKKSSAKIEAELVAVSAQLAAEEKNMASGDEYVWLINTIRQFQLGYKLDIPQYSTIVIGETTILPKFPYKQVMMTISGTGYFHDLGRFIADLENRFPQMRVQNLEAQPASNPTGNDFEKLSFKMDIVALKKSSP